MKPYQRREQNKEDQNTKPRKHLKKMDKPWGIKSVHLISDGLKKKHRWLRDDIEWFKTESARDDSVVDLGKSKWRGLDNKQMRFYRVKREGKKIIVEGEVKG